MAKRHDSKRIEALLRERDERGLTYRALAERSGIPAPTLTWWAHRLRKRASRAARSEAFVEVGVEVSSEPLEILIGECRILVRPGFDEATLRAAVVALGC